MPMTVGELRQLLIGKPDDQFVFMAIDEEGNGYGPAEDWTEDVTMLDERDNSTHNVLVLWPGYYGNWEWVGDDDED